MKWSVIGLILLGVAAAVCAAVLTVSLGVRQGRFAPIGAEPGERISIMVAAEDLPAVSVVPASAVTKAVMSRESAPPDYFSDPVQVVGKVLSAPVTRGQPFTAACFAPRGPGSNLAAGLPQGKRAVTLTLTDAGSLAGLIYPGATVDVLASFGMQQGGGNGRALSSILLQGVEVLAVEGQTVGVVHPTDASNPKAQIGAAIGTQNLKVTLLVAPKQAEALQLASIYGNVSLAMRNPQDTTPIDHDVMLLNEGQLARMGSFLDASTPGGTARPAASAQTQPAAPPAAPAFVARPGPKPWDVTILRGSTVEMRSFPSPEGSNPGDAP
jgi:Flp pilus assembly protein CpaB